MEMLSRDELTCVAGGTNPSFHLTLSQVAATYNFDNTSISGSYNWSNGNWSLGGSYTSGSWTFSGDFGSGGVNAGIRFNF